MDGFHLFLDEILHHMVDEKPPWFGNTARFASLRALMAYSYLPSKFIIIFTYYMSDAVLDQSLSSLGQLKYIMMSSHSTATS
jgi:hypothetical protein